MAQYVDIQDKWESTRFHCPACGAEVFTENGEPTNEPCEHLVFSWIDQVGEFYNPSNAVKAIIEADDEWLSPSDEEFISRLPDTTVYFALESCGMACGPVSLTVIHAIDFPVKNWDDDDEG